MRNTGILLFLVGVYLIWNSGSFRDVLLGKARLNFIDLSTARTIPVGSEDKGGGGKSANNPPKPSDNKSTVGGSGGPGPKVL